MTYQFGFGKSHRAVFQCYNGVPDRHGKWKWHSFDGHFPEEEKGPLVLCEQTTLLPPDPEWFCRGSNSLIEVKCQLARQIADHPLRVWPLSEIKAALNKILFPSGTRWGGLAWYWWRPCGTSFGRPRSCRWYWVTNEVFCFEINRELCWSALRERFLTCAKDSFHR